MDEITKELLRYTSFIMLQNPRNLAIVENAEALAQTGVDLFCQYASTSIERNGVFRVALSGGSTPLRMNRLLASMSVDEQPAWSAMQMFWSDERFLPATDPDSNVFMAKDTLLDHVNVLPDSIYAPQTENVKPEVAAKRYGELICDVFQTDLPKFDLILLGMGPDGHTASLFPGHPEVEHPSDALVQAVFDSPKPPPTRLTFTYRLINLARQVVFLVGGESKADAIAEIFGAPDQSGNLPAGKVAPAGKLLWVIDEAAASKLR